MKIYRHLDPTYQEVFVKEALVVAAFPAAGVEVCEGVSAVLHPVERRHGDHLGLLRAVPRDAGLQGAERGSGREGRHGGRGVLRDQGGQQSVGLSCDAQLH